MPERDQHWHAARVGIVRVAKLLAEEFLFRACFDVDARRDEAAAGERDERHPGQHRSAELALDEAAVCSCGSLQTAVVRCVRTETVRRVATGARNRYRARSRWVAGNSCSWRYPRNCRQSSLC